MWCLHEPLAFVAQAEAIYEVMLACTGVLVSMLRFSPLNGTVASSEADLLIGVG